MEKRSFGSQSKLIVAACAAVIVWGAHARGDDWSKHAVKLPTLERQIEESKLEIEKLIEEKQHLKDPEALGAVLDQITEKNKALAKQEEEYRQLSLHVRFKHPDRERMDERAYSRQKPKTDEGAHEGEGQAGLESHLNRLKQRVGITFPVPEKNRKKLEIPADFKTKLRLPASVVAEEEAPERILLRASEPEHERSTDEPAGDPHAPANEPPHH